MKNPEKSSTETGREQKGGVESEPRKLGEKEIFDELGREQESDFFEKHAEKVEFGEDMKEVIQRHLSQEIDEAAQQFAVIWAKDNRQRIKKEKGIDMNTLGISAKIKWCREQGGFIELKKNEQYEKQNDEIKNIRALKYNLEKDNIPVDSQYLTLNRLYHKAEKAEKELNRAKKQGKETEITVKEAELKELQQITQEIAQKLLKDDLKKRAGEQGLNNLINSVGDKDAYTQQRFSKERLSYVRSNLQDQLKGIAKEEDYLQFLNYTVEKKGIFGRKSIITDEQGKIVYRGKKSFGRHRFLSTEAKRAAKDRLEKRCKEEIEQDWEGLRTVEVEKAINQEVRQLARSPEKAEQGIESLYKKVRQRLVKEFREKEIEKESEAKERQKEMDEEEREEQRKRQEKEKKEYAKGEGKSILDIMDDLANKKGGFENLEGSWEKDKSGIGGFFESLGVPAEHFNEAEKRMRKKGMIYEKKKGPGLIAWILELIFQAWQAASEDIEAKKNNGEQSNSKK